MKRSKNYKNAQKLVDKEKLYTLEEAAEILPKISTTKFDASIEMHFTLQLTDKQKKDSIKGSIQLPHQVGEPAKILVLTTPDHSKDAEGADVVGGEELVKKIQGGWVDFDIVIATPDIMPKIAVLGKVLGPKGKMPNPKTGTVTNDLKKTVASYKQGKIDFRADDQGGIHQVVGKVSMKKEDLLENIKIFLKAVYSETKKYSINPFKSAFISASMSPSIKLDTNALMKELT